MEKVKGEGKASRGKRKRLDLGKGGEGVRLIRKIRAGEENE